MVCEPDDGLVNVNDSVAAMQDVDKVSNRELSLELDNSIVLDELDRLDLAIGGSEFIPQV